jgi:hypothetical protein
MTDVRTADISIVTADDDLIEPIDTEDSAVSWAAIAAGAFANAALTLLLMAFGAGMGFSAVSPWAGSGISLTTFSIGTGLYLIVMAMLASTVGGYLTGRLRTRWIAVHTDEVFFRDTAHGFMSWAAAVVVSAAVLGAAGAAIVSGATAGLTQRNANDGGPAAFYVDELFRPAPATAAASQAPAATTTDTTQPAAPAVAAPRHVTVDPSVRTEIARLLTRDFRDRKDLAPADRSYVAQVVATSTGLSPADADKRVGDVLTQAKSDLDAARSAAAQLSMWLTAALLAGALAASLAAIEGGQLRDRRVYP